MGYESESWNSWTTERWEKYIIAQQETSHRRLI